MQQHGVWRVREAGTQLGLEARGWGEAEVLQGRGEDQVHGQLREFEPHTGPGSTGKHQTVQSMNGFRYNVFVTLQSVALHCDTGADI